MLSFHVLTICLADITALNKLALDDTRELSSGVRKQGTGLFVLITDDKLLEVLARLGSDVIEELKDNSVRARLAVSNFHLDVLADTVMNNLSVSIIGHLLVDNVVSVVHVAEFLQSPLEEVLSAADVSVAFLKEHNEVTLMRVELTLSVVLKLSQVHVPLCREQRDELEVANSFRVLILELTSAGEALEKKWVAVDASDDDLVWDLHFVE